MYNQFKIDKNKEFWGDMVFWPSFGAILKICKKYNFD